MFLFFIVDTRDIKMFILDEADEMLSKGFKDQIYDVFQTLPPNTQVINLITLYETIRSYLIDSI